ncbi:unnamed protein product [Spirodela intermedia]|uniref:UDP-3-O-acyl-N-acetylglucosamine deacetylase n=1 Tax=Spirodela intermedia TaxID=51605 RepID=A0A7I8ILE3_SPIIN|nr:unnamed protein product [Spirodela intermedia]CAA6658632.1 unnamed protein product [Spirodela intermedia]
MFLRGVMARRSWPASVRTFRALASSPVSWEMTGKPQQTLASIVERSGTGLHSGVSATVRLLPAKAGEGRYFALAGDWVTIPATIDHVGICYNWYCEHLLSALEGSGVDNVRVEVEGGNEVPILDGSSREWVEAIEEAGLCSAKDNSGIEIAKLAPVVHEPLYVWRDDSFVAAFPNPKIQMTYGINFSQASAIGCQWLSFFPTDQHIYSQEIAPARTFCILEEVGSLRDVGLIQGDQLTMPYSSAGWINPPLRFQDEPCRHKVLDLIGDLSLLSENGNQGLPIAHLLAYKAGHALHARFTSHLKDLLIRHERTANQSTCSYPGAEWHPSRPHFSAEGGRKTGRISRQNGAVSPVRIDPSRALSGRQGKISQGSLRVLDPGKPRPPICSAEEPQSSAEKERSVIQRERERGMSLCSSRYQQARRFRSAKNQPASLPHPSFAQIMCANH